MCEAACLYSIGRSEARHPDKQRSETIAQQTNPCAIVMLSLLSTYSVILCRPRGPLTRFIGLVVVAIASLFSIAYLTYCLPSSSSRSNQGPTLPNQLATGGAQSSAPLRFVENPQRLVVFGDSWSDNGQYPIDPPPENLVFPRDAQQGQVWTDWLCATVGT